MKKMKNWKLKKQTKIGEIELLLSNPRIDEYGKRCILWKIQKGGKDFHVNEYSDHSCFSAEIVQHDSGIHLVNGRKIEEIDKAKNIQFNIEEIWEELGAIYEEMEKEREILKKEIVARLKSGEKKIEWGIVGCDYPHYQPWIRQIGDLKGQEQDIMEKATREIVGKKEYICNICEYLQKLTSFEITTQENMSNITSNHQFNEETQKYHSYKKSIVTRFETTLMDILAPRLARIEEEKIENEKAKREEEQLKKDEICFFGSELLSSVTYRFSHSLAARVKFSAPDHKEIKIYNTNNARYIDNAISTYDIKEELKEKGFSWNAAGKEWEIAYSEENEKMVIELLKKYDRKEKPSALGLVQCWECGCWVKPSRDGEWTPAGYYCGC